MEEKNTNDMYTDCNSPVIIAKELGNMIMPPRQLRVYMKHMITEYAGLLSIWAETA
jgi:hypothetical protein